MDGTYRSPGIVSTIRVVPPFSVSGLKLPCSGDSSLTQKAAPSTASWATTSPVGEWDPEELRGAEGRLVERHGGGAAADREEGRDRRGGHEASARPAGLRRNTNDTSDETGCRCVST